MTASNFRRFVRSSFVHLAEKRCALSEESIVARGHRKFIAHAIDQGDVDGGASGMLALLSGGIGNDSAHLE